MKATSGIEVGIAVVPRGPDEHGGAGASLVIHEFRVHAVAHCDLLPSGGERHVGEYIVTKDLVAEDHAGLLERPSVVLAHFGRKRTDSGVKAHLLEADLCAEQGKIHEDPWGDHDHAFGRCGVTGYIGHWNALSASLAGNASRKASVCFLIHTR